MLVTGAKGIVIDFGLCAVNHSEHKLAKPSHLRNKSMSDKSADVPNHDLRRYVPIEGHDHASKTFKSHLRNVGSNLASPIHVDLDIGDTNGVVSHLRP